MSPTAPLDDTHGASVAFTRKIRAWHARCRTVVAEFRLTPMPDDWQPGPDDPRLTDRETPRPQMSPRVRH